MLKGKPFVKWAGGKRQIIDKLMKFVPDEFDTYYEPFIGGGSMALHMLQNLPNTNFFSFNDKDFGIFAIWQSIKICPERLIEKVKEFKPSIESYREIKKSLPSMFEKEKCAYDILSDIALSKIAIHQTSYSGLGLKGGPLGGFAQTGQYKIDSRWNAETLVKNINKIHKFFNEKDIVLHNEDFYTYLRTGSAFDGSENDLIYCDPPYYTVGDQLYAETMTEEEHIQLKELLCRCNPHCFISYDDCDFIRNLYGDYEIIEVNTNYTLTNKGKNKELLIFLK